MTRGIQSGWFGIFALVLAALLGVMGFVMAPQAQAFVPYMVNTVVSPSELGGAMPLAAAFANDGKVYISAGSYIKVIDRYSGAISNLPGIYNGPSGLYLDWKSNFLYVADKFNCVIRMIDLNQTPPQINTIAGNGFCGSTGDGGLAVNARLAMPNSITMDAEGNLYIADTGNNKIRIINTSGYIDTYAGTGAAGFSGDFGPASSAILNGPTGVSVSREYGSLYIADSMNYVIREIGLYDGIINTIAGVPGVQGFVPTAGPAHSVSFGMPISVMAIERDVFVTDDSTHSVGIVEKDWDTGALNYFPIIGNGTAGFYGDGMDSMSALLNSPSGAIFAHPGNLYITDSGNKRIREINVRDSEPELIVMQSGLGSGIVNASPGVDINCSSDRFESGVVSLNRNLALTVSNDGGSQELGVMVRRGESYLSNSMDGQWNIRQLNIANTGAPENYNINYGVSNVVSGIYNAGMYGTTGAYAHRTGTISVDSAGKVTSSGFSPETIYDAALSADHNFLTGVMINTTTRFIRVSNRRGSGFVTADLAGKWAFKSFRVKMTGSTFDDTGIETGELTVDSYGGSYWGVSKGRTRYDNFGGMANIDSSGNVDFGSEPGEENHWVMGADRQTIIGVSKHTTSEVLSIMVFTRMAEDYNYITADMSGDWYFRGLITQQAGYPQMADSSRCDITGGVGGMAGLVNGVCFNPNGTIDGPFSFQTKLEMDGNWILDTMQYNWGCQAKPEYGTYITLNASPDGSSTFTGWESSNGSCSGTGPCSFNIYNGTVVTAIFNGTGGGGGGLNITTSSLPDALQNSYYSSNLAVAGGSGPFTWSVMAGVLPSGLSLNSSTGEISGTPNTIGYYSFTVQVEDYNHNTAQRGLSIMVTNFTITTVSLPGGSTGSSYNQTLSVSGGTPPYFWSIINGSLPPGLFINSSSGNIAGMPSSGGTYNFTAQAMDFNSMYAQRNLSINISIGVSTYNITSTSGLNGSISPTGSTVVNSGASQTYNFFPANGYAVDYVMVDTVNIGALSQYTFTNVTANHSIEVYFKSTTAIALPATGTLSSSQYGYNYGTNQHPTSLDVTFVNDGFEKLLHVRGYDIDYRGEVTVWFNGMQWASLNNTPNNAAGRDSLIWLPAEEMLPGTNTIRFTQNNANETWGVTRLGVYNAGTPLGYVLGTTGGDTQHAAGFDVWLPQMQPFYPAWEIELAGWDSDSNTEIVVDVNGKKLGTLPSGADNGLTATYQLYLPYDVLAGGENYLTFRHYLGGSYNWGVKLTNLTDSGWFGDTGQAPTTADITRFLVPVEGGVVRPMGVNFYDISSPTEVQVLVNGTGVGYAPMTAPLTWGTTQTYNVPPASATDWSLVRVEFDNINNPPSSSTWAVQPVEPVDTDSDGTPDFSDWAPNDPSEQNDNDNDGIGDNADQDDDNDGMPDTWEIANGFNPYSSADASTDADADGLTNLGEYALGSNPYNSDTDSDTIMDGADSGPTSASDTGPVITIPKGSYLASGYGWGFGTNQHQNVLVGKFTKESYDKLLHIQSYDVDAPNEIQVRLNGVHMGYLSGQNSANGIDTVIVIPLSMQVAGTNYVEISTIYNDGTWGVQRLGLFNYGITFGNIVGGTGDRTHPNGIEILYKEKNSSNLIELAGWDSDTNTEIALTLNGKSIGALPIGPDNGWTPLYQLYLPKEFNGGDVGRLRLNNSLSGTYNWGVKINAVRMGSTDSSADLGYMGGTPGTTVDEVSFLVPVPDEIEDYVRWLDFQTYDVDTSNELAIYLNGVQINFTLAVNPNAWNNNLSIALPRNQLSVVRFDNINNPGTSDIWAVRLANAQDADGDGYPNYLDAYPYYDVEWNNMDGDSLGDNSDSDRDGDLMDNYFEDTNGYNSYNAADGLGDTDSDGLSNSFEAYYGSNFASTDTDADTVADGLDSHPNDFNNNGAVVPLTQGSYASGGGGFGYGYGTNQHYSRLAATFTSNGQDKLLYVRAYDVDSADEIAVWLNGRLLGYMTGVSNTTGLDNIFLIPSDIQWSGTNRIEFIQKTPGDAWGVDRMGLFALGNTFGYIVGYTGGDRDHMNGIDLHIYKDHANVVEIAGWDSDTDDEIRMYFGEMQHYIGALPAGPDAGWTPMYQLYMPNEYLGNGSDFIRIKNKTPGAYNWGVRINAFHSSEGGIGYFGGAANTTVDELTYLVPVSGDYGNMPMQLWFYDTNPGELSVYVNGVLNTTVPSDIQSGIWGSLVNLQLPAGKISKVRVDNVYNPPSTNIWGVSVVNPSNMDGDPAPDYRDPWPNDNTRWADMDKDGIDDATDPDIDGDGMTNTWETANGFDPYNPNDGSADSDADGLSNYFEFIYGTNMYNTDSDGDMVLDGIDSAPALSNNTGMVVNAPMGSYTTTDYGWSYGTNQHYSVVTYVFNNPGVSKLLVVKGYNSSNQMTLVRFNGEEIGYMTGNLALGKANVWWLDKSKMKPGQNRIEFIRTGSGAWGISQLALFNPGITLGYIVGFTGGDRSHGEGVDIHVRGGKSTLIDMEAWDSDINNEITIKLGGTQEVGGLPVGMDNGWGIHYLYFWPSWYSGPNDDVVLSVMNYASPVYNWGIRLNSFYDAEQGVGYLSEPSTYMADGLVMLVPVAPEYGPMPLALEFKETQGSEVEVYVDGTPQGYAPFTQNLWGGLTTFSLSPDAIHQVNLNNAFNPPSNDSWGVRVVMPPDADNDSVPDYMDAWPNDPAEQFDTDADGVGNNLDTDDDNDGIPDSAEFSLNMDPWNPSDAALDNDSDQLNNYFEYIYGTSPVNPDSDGDAIMDGIDSAPTNPSFTGAVVSIPKGAYDINTYGWNYGTNLHNGALSGKFTKDSSPYKIFMVRGYDIDTSDEVEVRLNGQFIGYLTNSPNMSLTQANVWVLDSSRLRNGDNRIDFIQKTQGETWGVAELVLFNPGVTYGYIIGFTGGDRAHGEGIALHVPGNDSRFVELEGWDSDLNPEIEFQLAGWGETLYGMPIGPDNGWTPRYHLYLPKEYLTTGDNVLFIRNKLSPVYSWGIRFHGITNALDGLGYQGPGFSNTTINGAEILVPVMIDSGSMPLRLEFLDLQPGEVSVYINGGFVASTGSAGSTWDIPMDLALPANQMVKVTVDNTQNPPSTAYWGVRISDAVDTDMDGVVNYLDPFPNDPTETADHDNDGIGDNADTDDDNDLMPDTFENANGLNPYDPSDGLIDGDSDGLRRSYEYVFGTSDSNPDFDGDSANDGADGEPSTWNATPPPVISLTTGVLNTGSFGWNYGTNSHQSSVMVKFNKDGYDKLLRVKGYDLESATDVLVYLNGQPYGYLGASLDNTVGVGEVFWIEDKSLQPGENRVQFAHMGTPGDTWGVTSMSVINPGNSFGYIVGLTGGDRSHGSGVRLHFQGVRMKGGYLELAAWDSDSLTEIALNFNGVPMFYLPTIGDVTWSPWFQLYLPEEYVQPGDNVLFINNPAGSTYNWGVKLNALYSDILTLGNDMLGWWNGQTTMVDEVNILIPVFASQRYIDLGYYSLSTNEVSVTIDGAPNGNLPATSPPSNWGWQSNYLLLSTNKMHVLKADNLNNPPGTDFWGVLINDYHP